MIAAIPERLLPSVQALWEYHDMRHEARRSDVAIGLGSHDLGVATCCAELFHQGLVPRIVFTGANAPTTVERFPRGEAVHYREHAMELGVPDEAILIETQAVNTGQNLAFTRALLAANRIEVDAVILVSRPYQQRRAYATGRKIWPEVDVRCRSQQLSLDAYVAGIGDPDRVINMLVGDTQRVIEYPLRGFAIEQEMPDAVREALMRLIEAGYTSRLLPWTSG